MKHDATGLIFGVACFVIGATLLYDGASGKNAVQGETITGAAVLSIGAVTLGIALRDWLKWKRDFRNYREG